MQRSYLDYAMSVIVGRALPDVRDGLKPVHRKILYAMFDSGFRPDRGYVKCARVVGDVMGNYHPHGDSAIYDTLVRMAQPWSLRYPLIDGNGNFGSPGNDPAAAMRYTESRLAPLAMEMLRDIDEDTVDFRTELRRPGQGADDPAGPVPEPAGQRLRGHRGRHGHQHPAAQPARDRRGRAVVPGQPGGRRGDHARRAASSIVKGPDFPTGGLIVGTDGDRGRVPDRPRLDPDARGGRGRGGQARAAPCLVVTELPYQVNPDNLAERIAELVKEGKLAGIADIRDESTGRTGMRLVLVLKRDAVAKVVLNNLYKHTQLQETFGANMLALVDGVPRTLQPGPVHPATTSRTRSRSSSGGPRTGCARPRSGRTSCAAWSRRSTCSTRSSP